MWGRHASVHIGRIGRGLFVNFGLRTLVYPKKNCNFAAENRAKILREAIVNKYYRRKLSAGQALRHS